MITFLQRTYIAVFSVSMLHACNILCMESILPLSIGKYRIQSPQERNTIITDLDNECSDGIVYLFSYLSNSSFLDKNFVGHITGIYNDLGLHQSLFFMQLIGQLVLKTNRLSSEIVEFINNQRKIYHCIDKDGNIDKTGNFLKAFDDAKIRFYYLIPVLKKTLYNKILTEDEYHYLVKNMHLVNVLRKRNVKIERKFVERFHEEVIRRGGYVNNFTPSFAAAVAGAFVNSILRNDDIYSMNDLYFYSIQGIIVFNAYFIIARVESITLSANANILPRRVTIPFKRDDIFVSLEDMSEIIEQAPWLV